MKRTTKANALFEQGVEQNTKRKSTRIFSEFFRLSNITNRIWVIQYELEEARQRHATKGRLLPQAAACIALALMRFCGVRHVS